ncbi:low-specificity L-threonine aldolase [Pseudomarimonas arenosa]|uniref:Low-specificity L-threonine aldolase n=1 Tax=Pseudomarimonas arenosa TaxID=2774145 RepID=A0AAW3ZPG5_9GAMM|nr:low-specificity L-threonine aldolase [Pseudomarimonas arenosa]MBD8527848.1 low-specificity L-threonine aldolase [Pseudomarimonas arenosa]
MIDLRSDTVTQPTVAMRAAMADAELGDDVYGEDPSVNRLQARLAEQLGFDAGLFVPSGTQSNLLALLSHCQRGDEYLVGADAHTYKYEGGGAAVLGSIQPQPLAQDSDGTIALERLRAALKPVDPHFARSRLVCLENTWHGRPLPRDYAPKVRAFCDQHGLGLHLDGARLFNAAVSQQINPAELCRPYHSVSLCFSKGLGAPVGSVLLGSTELIEQARRWRKVCGGGWRQAGMLAAACSFALDHHVERLSEDHRRAATMAAALSDAGYELLGQHSNMLFLNLSPTQQTHLKARLAEQQIIISTGYLPTLRLVLHLDIDDSKLERVIEAFKRIRPNLAD